MWRDLLLAEMSRAHEALLALFGGVHEGDLTGAVAALDQIADVGERLECPELAEWCRREARAPEDASLASLAAALPHLLAHWERAQDSVIARAFPLGARGVRS